MNDTMTHEDSGSSLPPPPPPGRPRQLRRAKDDRIIGGVATGVAHYLDVPRWLIIVGFIILTPFGGLGILLYALGWLLIPEEGASASIVEGWVKSSDDVTMWVGIALVVIGAIAVVSWLDLVAAQLVWAAALITVGVLLYQGKLRGPDPADQVPPAASADIVDPHQPPVGDVEPRPVAGDELPPPPGGAALVSTRTDVVGGGTPPPGDGGVGTLPPPPAPARRQPTSTMLGSVTFGAALVAIGILAALDVGGVVDATLRHYLALALVMLGGGLLLGTFYGKTRAPIVVGMLIIPALVVASFVRLPLADGIGERRYVPATAEEVAAEYDLGIGSLSVDLRRVDPGEEPLFVNVEVGIGEAIVVLPAGVGADVSARAGLGEVIVFGSTDDGWEPEQSVRRDGEGLIVLDVEAGLGSVKVRAASIERPPAGADAVRPLPDDRVVDLLPVWDRSRAPEHVWPLVERGEDLAPAEADERPTEEAP
jgi:phage shock protein PspC (stress-responsive transcriptional regulator)